VPDACAVLWLSGRGPVGGFTALLRPGTRAMSTRPIRIFLIDDHAIIAMGGESLLEGARGIRLVGHAASGSDALARLDTMKPDVVLLDIGLRDESGIATMRKLHARDPSIRVLG
jgi:CheY-like chemotaxis protein